MVPQSAQCPCCDRRTVIYCQEAGEASPTLMALSTGTGSDSRSKIAVEGFLADGLTTRWTRGTMSLGMSRSYNKSW